MTPNDERVLADQAVIAKLKRIMVKFGEISDYQYDNNGIFMDDTHRVDGLPIHRRRNIILTHCRVIRGRLAEEERTQKAAVDAAAAKELKAEQARKKKADKEAMYQLASRAEQSKERGAFNLQYMMNKCSKK